MRIILLFLAIISSTVLLAQPTFTSSNFNPTIGEILGGHTIDTTSYSPPALGTNMTWDYSNLVLESSPASGPTYVNPSTTPYAASYPSANAAIGSSNAYNYYLFNSTGQYHYGEASPSQLVSEYDPGTLYTFPFTYGFNLTDSMHANFMAGTFPAVRAGRIVTTADGWGTLILPNGTYTNVMHVTQRWDIDETVDYGSLTMTGTFVYKHSYWFKPNTHFPLLYYSEFGIVNASIQNWANVAGYIDAAFVGVEENEGSFQFNVFPNPSESRTINLQWFGENSERINLNVINTIGEIVYSSSLNGTIGINQFVIQLEDLSSGIYFMELSNESKNGVIKLILE